MSHVHTSSGVALSEEAMAAPTFLPKKIEDLREGSPACRGSTRRAPRCRSNHCTIAALARSRSRPRTRAPRLQCE